MTEFEPGNFEPSNTALTAAAARAAHLIVDAPPLIFRDTLAATLLGDRAEELVGYHRQHGDHPILSAARAQVTCRSRYAEDCLAAAADRAGVAQYVLLGAGLDSFGYRSPLAERVRVFEVDHPRTQLWKRRALSQAGVDVPAWLHFVPAELGRDSLPDALANAGFDHGDPAIIGWLGVTMYLPETDIREVLRWLASCAAGTQLVADFMLPENLRDAAGQQYVDLVAPAAAERGEPWQTFLGPEQLSGMLAEHEGIEAEYLHQRELVPAALWQRTDTLRPGELSMMVRASVGC